MAETSDEAPGRPGVPPRWTSSAKTGIGTAGKAASRVWFTLSHGIVNEVYFPHPDLPCIRDLGLIVTDGDAFFSEEKRDADSAQRSLAEGVPAFGLVNTCRSGRYRIEKEILTDPRRDVLLQRIRFVPLVGAIAGYKIHVLLSPHLGEGGENSGRLGDYKGQAMLLASQGGLSLALACSAPWAGRSVGFVGVSDGWQDLHRHRRLTWHHAKAEGGNIALVGEVDLRGTDGVFVVALGFGRHPEGAALRARGALVAGFDAARAEYLDGWRAWQETLAPPAAPEGMPEVASACRVGAAVLRCHEDSSVPGGLIASLSIPWGASKGDDDIGGYHLVWPRDLVEVAGGLLAVGARDDARRILTYLRVTQEADGHWPQNMWLDGTTYWDGIQMDETALPILLVDLARRHGALAPAEVPGFWPMIRRAAGYLARNGPATGQDRWEEDGGYTPFTLAAEVAALLVAAEYAEECGEADSAAFLRETADCWNASIEGWIYAEGTDLAREQGVPGYYVRVAAPALDGDSPAWRGSVAIKNRPDAPEIPDARVVSPDALALVRFGLRAPDDPRVVATIRVVDALLKVETPHGPAWHRYDDDGYGEHDDGSPFDGKGVGRAWPLLVGERGHYELAAGRPEEARRLLKAMLDFASEGGLIPEQVWDSPDIPARGLFFGRPSGSAMPLAWAHAEYLKLARSLADGRPFDLPPQAARRYLVDKVGSDLAAWSFRARFPALSRGKTLRVHALAAARVRWWLDGEGPREAVTRETGFGAFFVDLPTADLPPGSVVRFAFFWTDAGRWEGEDFAVTVAP